MRTYLPAPRCTASASMSAVQACPLSVKVACDRRPQAEAEDDARGLGRRVRADMGADRGSAGCADCRHPAWIARRRILRLLIHGVGVAGGHQRQRTECIDLRERDLIGNATKVHCDPIGERCSNAGAHLDVVTMDGDPAVGSNFDRCERTVASGAVVLRSASDAGTDENSPLLSARLLLGPLLPDRMLLQLVQDLRRADRNDVGVSRHGPAAGRERIAAPELDRVERQRRADLIDQHFERGHRLQSSVTAHRARSHAARVERIGRHIDFRDVVDAKRGVGADGRHLGGEIGKASAIQRMVGGESDHLAGRPIDPNPCADLEGVPLDSQLKLLEAVVREPHRTVREKHRRKCDVEWERGMVATAESTTAIGEIVVDARRPEGRLRIAE